MWGQHHRYAIWNAQQHPYKHVLTDFVYTTPGMPGVTNLQSALDWIIAVLYPQMQPAVATTADLPLTGNTLNDYRVVNDTGSGKAGGFRWEQREGEASPSWHQISEVDWGADSVLQEWQQRTQDQFVMRYGYDAIDGSGVAITGLFAGQTVYGGRSANTNLTLYPNAGDGAGAVSGFVQFAGNVRPTTDNGVALGTTAKRFSTLYSVTAVHGTLTVGAGSVVDSSGTISFGATALTTSSTVTAGTLAIGAGSVTDSSGTISFGTTNLTGTGALTIKSVTATGAVSQFSSGTKIGNLTLSSGSITDSGGTVSFGNNAVATTGSISGATGSFTTSVGAGNLSLAANTIASTNSNGNIVLTPNGAGTVNVSSTLNAGVFQATSSAVSVTNGTLTVSGTGAAATVANLHLAADTISTTDTNGDLILAPNGTGAISTSTLYPSADNTKDLGKTGARYATLYLGTAIGDGTNTLPIATLMSLRAINTGVSSGNGIFWDGTKWIAADPDTEVFHDSISHLTGFGTDGDAGHSQFVVAAGRASAQTIKGGTAASANLTLDSTAHATKGSVLSGSTFAPTAALTGTLDLGIATTNVWRSLYLGGEIFGCRVENTTAGTIPAASASNPGRLVFETDTKDLFVDVGGTWKKIGLDTYLNIDSTTWTGAVTTHSYDVSASFVDARKAVWQLQDNANNRKVILCDISFPDATHVTITVDIPLASGTYTLVGVG